MSSENVSPRVPGRFGPGSFRPGSFRTILRVGQFGLVGGSFRAWVVSAPSHFGPISIG